MAQNRSQTNIAGGPDQPITDKPTRIIDRAATGQIKSRRKLGDRYRDISIPSHSNLKESIDSSIRFTCQGGNYSKQLPTH
jgi:hypothetical protein